MLHLRVADDKFAVDLKDLRSMLTYIGDNREKLSTIYGNISNASIGAIQRALLLLENRGSWIFLER